MTTAKYLWVDIETTGLDPYEDHILELAAVVTDKGLNTLEEFEAVIKPGGCWSSEAAKLRSNPFVQNMHTVNGLWAATDTGDDLDEVLSQLYTLINEHEWADSKPILAGSSVQFDRSFLKADAPHIENLLHYRQFDVSTLKMNYEDHLGRPFVKYETAHRAMADIKQSIEATHRARYVMSRQAG
jgi:oligoribonuclease